MNMFTLIAPFYDTLMTTVHKRQGGHLLRELEPWTGKRVLDAGGGTGRLAAQMQGSGAQVWLLDLSPQMLKRCRKVLPRERCVQGDAADMPFTDGHFDVVTTVDAIHHIRPQREMLREVWRVLAPGGLFAVLDFTPEDSYVRALAGLEKLAGEPALFLAPSQLESMLAEAGFTHIRTRRLSAREYLTLAGKSE
jgi:ubiquinone/menaquinone biosynthesis C-methylase UbiE